MTATFQRRRRRRSSRKSTSSCVLSRRRGNSPSSSGLNNFLLFVVVVVVVAAASMSSPSVTAFVTTGSRTRRGYGGGGGGDGGVIGSDGRGGGGGVTTPSVCLKSSAGPEIVRVAVTRELGKNDKLISALATGVENREDADDYGENPPTIIEAVELPCIEHADGPDLNVLSERLSSEEWDYVVVTSPEAARVLSSSWDSAMKMTTTTTASATRRRLPPMVAAVGKATERALNEKGIDVAFCPSKATAKTLVKELPLPDENNNNNNGSDDNKEEGEGGRRRPRVLYPASCRAQTTLQDGLRRRGFDVIRLNTYDTVTSNWNQRQRDEGSRCRIACFASPSSIKGWLQNTGGDGDGGGDNTNGRSVLAACIGETSAQACRDSGWDEDRIFYPEKPGIEGWVDAIRRAGDSLAKKAAHPVVAE